MKFLIQRVTKSSVTVEGEIKATIQKGLLILVGIGLDDTSEDIQWLCKKAAQMRIFNDEDGRMNLDINQIKGSIILVSQFTLMANCKKGNRPSYIKAAGSDEAIILFDEVIKTMKNILGADRVGHGVFGADMKVDLLNDGPVTIMLDSKHKE